MDRITLTATPSSIAEEVSAGRLRPGAITEKTIQKYLDEPDLPDVDLFLRSSGEQRLSNFMLWQSAYAEFVFLDTLWPDVDRRVLWRAIDEFAQQIRSELDFSPHERFETGIEKTVDWYLANEDWWRAIARGSHRAARRAPKQALSPGAVARRR